MKLIYILTSFITLVILGCFYPPNTEVISSDDALDQLTKNGLILTDTIATTQVPFDIDTFIAQKEKSEKNETLMIEKNVAPPIVNKKKIKSKKILKPHIEFEQEVYELGELVSGEIVEQKFIFKNVGNAPLNIKKAEGTCGCTMPSYPFLAIEPGGNGVIGVTYNSVGKNGLQEPEILVYSDDQSQPITKLKMLIDVIIKPTKTNESIDSTTLGG